MVHSFVSITLNLLEAQGEAQSFIQVNVNWQVWEGDWLVQLHPVKLTTTQSVIRFTIYTDSNGWHTVCDTGLLTSLSDWLPWPPLVSRLLLAVLFLNSSESRLALAKAKIQNKAWWGWSTAVRWII